MKINKVHCMFEQSGTFKRAFQKQGITAFDYDIRNDFDETDNVVDLFREIERAYAGEQSVFDEIGSDDLIIAFFPCVRFEEQIQLAFRVTQYQLKNKNDEEKLEYDLRLHRQLADFYEKVTKLAIACLRKKLRLIIENPYSSTHYLTKYWALKPKIIDKDRRKNGDYYTKPTQYWFVNCEPNEEPLFEAPVWRAERKTIAHMRNQVARSLISNEYAERFIREYIL